MTYLDILKEVELIINIDTTDINLLLDKLNRLERLKYQITDYLVAFENGVLAGGLKTLNNMLDDTKRWNKVLGSSTLTKDVLNATNLTTYARYRKMQEYLRNIRGSITSTITMVSLEKDLRKLGGDRP